MPIDRTFISFFGNKRVDFFRRQAAVLAIRKRVSRRVQAVIEICLAKGEPDAERIIAQVRRRATLNSPAPPLEAIPLCQYQVPRPQLSRFDQLLSHGDCADGR